LGQYQGTLSRYNAGYCKKTPVGYTALIFYYPYPDIFYVAVIFRKTNKQKLSSSLMLPRFPSGGKVD
jgi:hypothetical protein